MTLPLIYEITSRHVDKYALKSPDGFESPDSMESVESEGQDLSLDLIRDLTFTSSIICLLRGYIPQVRDSANERCLEKEHVYQDVYLLLL